MPTFINPRKVIVEPGGGGNVLLAAVLAAVLSSVIYAERVLIEDIMQMILAVLGTVAVAGSVVLVLVLKRTAGTTWRPALVRQARPAQAISAPTQLAIEGRVIAIDALGAAAVAEARTSWPQPSDTGRRLRDSPGDTRAPVPHRRSM